MKKEKEEDEDRLDKVVDDDTSVIVETHSMRMDDNGAAQVSQDANYQDLEGYSFLEGSSSWMTPPRNYIPQGPDNWHLETLEQRRCHPCAWNGFRQ